MGGVKCDYPGCEQDSCMLIALSLDPPSYKQPKQTNASFCKYHGVIVGNKPNEFIVLCNEKGSHKLLGPFEEISMIEGVMAAREITKREQPKNVEELKKSF